MSAKKTSRSYETNDILIDFWKYDIQPSEGEYTVGSVEIYRNSEACSQRKYCDVS